MPVDLRSSSTPAVFLQAIVVLSWIMVSLPLVMEQPLMGLSIGWLRIHGALDGVKRDTSGCKGMLVLQKDCVVLP